MILKSREICLWNFVWLVSLIAIVLYDMMDWIQGMEIREWWLIMLCFDLGNSIAWTKWLFSMESFHKWKRSLILWEMRLQMGLQWLWKPWCCGQNRCRWLFLETLLILLGFFEILMAHISSFIVACLLDWCFSFGRVIGSVQSAFVLFCTIVNN